jgi:hypothetical protein
VLVSQRPWAARPIHLRSKGASVASKKSQIEKFRDKARELGIDESESKFDAALRKMVHGTPKEAQEATDELSDMLRQNDPKKD